MKEINVTKRNNSTNDCSFLIGIRTVPVPVAAKFFEHNN